MTNRINDKDEKIYSYMLSLIPGIGSVTISYLLESLGTPRAVFEAKEEELDKIPGIGKKKIRDIKKTLLSKEDIQKKIIKWESNGIRSLFIYEKDYPLTLSNIIDAPFVLYYKGRLPLDEVPSVAIVGARGCSDYGKNMAYRFGKELAMEGFQIISGMATGADNYGHMGALAGGGYTAGVLGCGVDICYPRTNITTYFEIQKKGCVISEVPPGTDPEPGFFPRRNRLISALADAVIIVEARERSGSLITADQALEQGKDVYAVPGRIGDPLSSGCLQLIKQGAYPLTDIKDIMECDSIKRKISNLKKGSVKSDAESKVYSSSKEEQTDQIVFKVLTDFPKNINRIMYETNLSYEKTAQAIVNLELEGMLRSVSAGLYVRAGI